jgi:hypothetical protein
MDAAKKVKLVKVEQGGYDIGLPEGWALDASDAYDRSVVVLSAKKGAAVLVVMKHSPFISRSGHGEIAASAVKSAAGNAQRVFGPWALGGSVTSPVIEGWTGTVTTKGQEMLMGFYVAWNMESLGAKYTILMTLPGGEFQAMEVPFAAMVMSF